MLLAGALCFRQAFQATTDCLLTVIKMTAHCFHNPALRVDCLFHLHHFKMVVLTSYVTCILWGLTYRGIESYPAWSWEAVKSASRLVLVVNSTGAHLFRCGCNSAVVLPQPEPSHLSSFSFKHPHPTPTPSQLDGYNVVESDHLEDGEEMQRRV